MSEMYTIDASVIVNAFNVGEIGHDESLAFLSAVRTEGAAIVVPTLLVPEVAGAIARGRQDAALAKSLALDLGRLAALVMISLDQSLASEARDIAVEHRLRGADAVYAAVAFRFGSTLVTRDREQRDRLAGLLNVRSPEEALADQGR
jgi:predicted nucleic acid-binding protein